MMLNVSVTSLKKKKYTKLFAEIILGLDLKYSFYAYSICPGFLKPELGRCGLCCCLLSRYSPSYFEFLRNKQF